MLSWMSQPTRYLEIGLDDGWTFVAVESEESIGVDPNPRFDLSRLSAHQKVLATTSDDFFASQDEEAKFDLVFIDGLHTAEQTLRDIRNAFKVLNTGGVILIDDVIPSDEVSAIPNHVESLRVRAASGLPGSAWHGDVFRVLGAIQHCEPWLNWVTLDDRARDDRRNPQTVLWRNNMTPFSPDLLDEEFLLASDYSEVFGAGVPPLFNARPETDALAAIEDFLRHHPTSQRY